MLWDSIFVLFFYFNDTATTQIYTDVHTLSLLVALPISRQGASAGHSSAMAQSSNAVAALSRPALRVSPCGPVAASTRLDGVKPPPSTLLLAKIGRAHV